MTNLSNRSPRNGFGVPYSKLGTDIWLVPAKSQIQMHKVKYRGTPIFGDDGEEYVKYLPGEVKYVGEPSDEIDEAWNELTKSNSSI